MAMPRRGRYQEEMSRQELIEIVFGCALAAVLVGHLIVNGERPSVDEHFLSLSILAGFFAGIAFNRPVVMMIREWKAQRTPSAEFTEEQETPKDAP